MLRLLPVFAIIIAIVAGLIYYRFSGTQNLSKPTILNSSSSMDDRVTTLEKAVGTLIKQPTSLVQPTTQENNNTSTSLQDKVSSLEKTVNDLKTKVTNLEQAKTVTTQATPQPSTSKSPMYIPLGTGSTTASDWTNIDSVAVTIDPADYSGYTSMQLESSLKVFQTGTTYVRLGNKDAGTSILSSEISTTSTSDTWLTSSTFTLPSGKKTYILQMKSQISGYTATASNTRIKVNF